MFAFVVRKLRWLAKVPGAPQVFDAILLGATGLFYPARLRAISEIEAQVRRWPGTEIGVHRFGGIGFFFQGKESSHIHGNGLLDCFVGRTNRDEILRNGRALLHHIFPHSGWISFWIQDEEDVRPALELIRIAAERQTAA
jgi:luciferase-like monooxygenase